MKITVRCFKYLVINQIIECNQLSSANKSKITSNKATPIVFRIVKTTKSIY